MDESGRSHGLKAEGAVVGETAKVHIF